MRTGLVLEAFTMALTARRPPAESWFGGFKNELVHPIGAFATRRQAQPEIVRYLRWHDSTRRHSALNMLAPHAWERALTLTRTA